MHVVQALASLNVGGSELVATELTAHLAAKGHRVTVLAGDGPLTQTVQDLGADRLDWPVGRKRLQTLRYIRQFREWLQEAGPDLVHAHSRVPAWICLRAIAGLPVERRPAFVTSVHGQYSVSPYSAVMTRGERVICVSEHIRDFTRAHYRKADPEKLITIHGGIDHDLFPFGHEPSDDWRSSVEAEFPGILDRPWVLLPARLSRYKGHADLLQALARLSERGHDVQGVIVGGLRPGSRYQDELEALSRSLGVADRVTFTGVRNDIRDWLAQAAVVVSLTRDPPEAFGRTVLESLSLGTPVVGWAHGGVEEILVRMFPRGGLRPGDLGALTDTLAEVLQRPPVVAPSMAFSLTRSMERHLDLYSELLSEKNQ